MKCFYVILKKTTK